MNYTFTLRLDRDPNELADELYEAGLDDALLSSGPDGHTAEFDRDASSFWEAVTSAIADAQKTVVRVLGVDSDRLLTGADVAEQLHRSRQHVTRLTATPGFPAPTRRVGPRVVLYSRNEVLAWARQTNRLPEGSATPASHELPLLAALNAALAWRAASPALDQQSRQRVQALADVRLDSVAA